MPPEAERTAPSAPCIPAGFPRLPAYGSGYLRPNTRRRSSPTTIFSLWRITNQILFPAHSPRTKNPAARDKWAGTRLPSIRTKATVGSIAEIRTNSPSQGEVDVERDFWFYPGRLRFSHCKSDLGIRQKKQAEVETFSHPILPYLPTPCRLPHRRKDYRSLGSLRLRPIQQGKHQDLLQPASGEKTARNQGAVRAKNQRNQAPRSERRTRAVQRTRVPVGKVFRWAQDRPARRTFPAPFVPAHRLFHDAGHRQHAGRANCGRQRENYSQEATPKEST
ncbi:hypothetical protein J2Z49_001923 [Desulfofundulus luciae]|uniref:Uncharacterized protein n=1 Tax=Desulfofundulus luciae TaxID=74702 RepID=A0ABU0B4D0_9FIRM|nr:hypothetical protein [Desulfofundulus luciae]